MTAPSITVPAAISLLIFLYAIHLLGKAHLVCMNCLTVFFKFAIDKELLP